MSTILYLVCEDHNPELRSDGVGFLRNLPRVQDDIQRREEIVRLWPDENGYDYDRGDSDRNNTARFLTQHPNCNLRIEDENGVEYGLEADKPVAAKVNFGRIEYIQQIEQGLIVRFTDLTPAGEEWLRKMRVDQ